MPARTKQVFITILIAAGSTMLLLAFGAGWLGLDHNAGWGWPRLTLLWLGILLAIIAMGLWRAREGSLSSWLFSDTSHQLERQVSQTSPFIWLSGLVIIIFFAGYFVWYVSEGTWQMKGHGTLYYPALAEAFLNGQLHLLENPPTDLIQLPDPYNWQAREGIGFLHDASLYRGKYYLYWGPVPALISMTWKLLAGDFLNDAQLVLVFYILCQVAIQRLLRVIWRRFTPGLHWVILLPLYLLAAINAPLAFVFGRASVYEAAILGGQAFLLTGVVCFDLYLLKHNQTCVWLGSLSLAWAAGCRSSLVFAIAVIVAAMAFHLWKIVSKQQVVMRLIALLLPLTAGAGVLAWYNWTRFGSVTEQGMRYALTVVNFLKEYPHLVSPAYLPANAYLFLLRPLPLGNLFPLQLSWITDRSWPFFIPLADHYYYSEPVYGLLFVFPFLVMAFIPLLFYLTRSWPYTHGLPGKTSGSFFWQVYAVLLAALILEFVFVSSFFAPMTRYLLDVVFLAVLAAAMGWLEGQAFLGNSHAGRIVRWAGLGLFLISLWFGWQFIAASHVVYYGQ